MTEDHTFEQGEGLMLRDSHIGELSNDGRYLGPDIEHLGVLRRSV